MPSVQEYIASGLYDPDDALHAGRVELLDWLASQGFTIDDMWRADSIAALASLAGDRRLLPGVRRSRAEAIRRSGLDPVLFDRVTTAFGYLPVDGPPDGEVAFTDAEIDALAALGPLTAMFSVDEALGLARVIGSALGRIAEASQALFVSEVESPHLEAGNTELGLAHKIYDAIGLLDGLTDQLDPILRRHVMQATERTRRATVAAAPDRYRFAVGFVDLVGFTSASAGMGARELRQFVGRFDGLAHDVAIAAGARVVKLIGDEVMFVSPDPADACRAGLALMDALAGDDDRVVPRGGIAYGDVVLRDGDYFGPVANLASRIVDEAVPLELLVSDALADAAPTCQFEPAGRRMVKGFDEPVSVWSLRGRAPAEHT